MPEVECLICSQKKGIDALFDMCRFFFSLLAISLQHNTLLSLTLNQHLHRKKNYSTWRWNDVESTLKMNRGKMLQYEKKRWRRKEKQKTDRIVYSLLVEHLRSEELNNLLRKCVRNGRSENERHRARERERWKAILWGKPKGIFSTLHLQWKDLLDDVHHFEWKYHRQWNSKRKKWAKFPKTNNFGLPNNTLKFHLLS